MRKTLTVLFALTFSLPAAAQEKPESTGPRPTRVEISPPRLEAEVGQSVKFSAAAFDDEGRRLDLKPTAWFAAPFDVASAIDESGSVTFFLPGEVRIGAIVGGKPGFATVLVKPQSVSRIEIEPVQAPVAVGAGVTLVASARTPNGDPRVDAEITWTSETPAVAAIDAAGLVTGVAPGKARLVGRSGQASAAAAITVIANPVRSLAVTPRSTRARTEDVVHFSASASGDKGAASNAPAIRWAVSGAGTVIESDGSFVAEQPGSYTITASSGDKSAVASVVVSPRNVAAARGRGPNTARGVSDDRRVDRRQLRVCRVDRRTRVGVRHFESRVAGQDGLDRIRRAPRQRRQHDG